MITHNVTIEREGKYWLVRIDGTDGLTQARHYSEVATMAKEYLSLVEGVPREEIAIGTITVRGASERLQRATADREKARNLEASAQRNIREIACYLRSQNVPLVEIGQIIGVSHQRAHQLVNS